jgi:hypothetical protein
MSVNNQSQLELFNPSHLLIFFSFYSPVLLASAILILSLFYQNVKGLIYFSFLLGSCILRNYLYMFQGGTPFVNDNTICTSVQYSKYGNPSFSIFVFSFTIMYLAFPMFMNQSVNFFIFTFLITFGLFDMFIKWYKGCVRNLTDIFLNIVFGSLSSLLIVILMNLGGSGHYLFFNEIQNNKEVCSMPDKQTFKCQVYKNGELIG